MEKADILEEIRRLAKINGNPPGKNLFATKTGIREHEWCGRFWARWSDAVREAGLEPNLKTRAYDDEYLIEKLISLARELKHFPVFPELVLKSNNDTKFPSEKSYRRFGGKQRLLSTVLRYCTGRTGYDDIIAMCEPIAANVDLNVDLPIQPVSDHVRGYVYLGKSGKHYKIGMSKGLPGQREGQLASQLLEGFEVIHRILTDDPEGIEAYWKRRFAEKLALKKEYFALNAADIAAFKLRRKFM